jgi:hypothetical protein
MCAEEQSKTALELRDAFNAVSPFIQRHTMLVCPLCKKVCCINKHGDFDTDDLVFINPMGIEVPHDSPDRKETDPCRFLKVNGCMLQRWRRPFRCTWYFCEPLLESMREDNSKDYRVFIRSLQRLVSIRQQLLAHSY